MVLYCISIILLSFLKIMFIFMLKRFELVLYVFIANGVFFNFEYFSQYSCFERGVSFFVDFVVLKGKNVVDEFFFRSLDCKLGCLDLEDDLRDVSDDVSVLFVEGVIDF